jgi:hypothetical protein
MTGKQVIELFKRYDITEYVLSCYEALHTTGTNYIVEDIDLFIEARADHTAQVRGAREVHTADL